MHFFNENMFVTCGWKLCNFGQVRPIKRRGWHRVTQAGAGGHLQLSTLLCAPRSARTDALNLHHASFYTITKRHWTLGVSLHCNKLSKQPNMLILALLPSLLTQAKSLLFFGMVVNLYRRNNFNSNGFWCGQIKDHSSQNSWFPNCPCKFFFQNCPFFAKTISVHGIHKKRFIFLFHQNIKSKRKDSSIKIEF